MPVYLEPALTCSKVESMTGNKRVGNYAKGFAYK